MRRLPAIISPADVTEGDTITVSTQRGDVKQSATGVVDRIVRSSSEVAFLSPEGHEFGRFRYGSKSRVVLIAVSKVDHAPEPLFTLDSIA